MNHAPFKPVVIIPSYNTGWRLRSTVAKARAQTSPVWVAVDGSTDGSDEALAALDPSDDADAPFRVLRRPVNAGKGAILLHAAKVARDAGFTHMLTLDADGQHPAERIPSFLAQARAHPDALIMGAPVFGPDVPRARLHGRKLTIAWTDLETLWCGLGDTLFGMRVYPIGPFIQAMQQTPFARGFDFDPEVAVRLCWVGCRPLQVEAPVRYWGKDEGGVSHFHYLRDNIKLTFLHFRLVPEFLIWRIWSYLPHWRRWRKH